MARKMSLVDDPYLDSRICREIGDVLRVLEGAQARRTGSDEAGAADDILAAPKAYGMHLDAIKRSGGEGWTPRSRVCARFCARTTGTSRKPRWSAARARTRRRAEGIAHILDDPEKLRELRREYEERKRSERRQRKGRHRSRDMRM
ncbi:MAG: hypothetical protein OXI75_02850 [Rhodospirillales bacterium]|nr:hypothetical protein [Rhodospirillales bacterium]